VLNAVRVYNPSQLPGLPSAEVKGRRGYARVILPAVRFHGSEAGGLKVRFADLPPERCAHSDMISTPPATSSGSVRYWLPVNAGAVGAAPRAAAGQCLALIAFGFYARQHLLRSWELQINVASA
jgi:hypothetical protein